MLTYYEYAALSKTPHALADGLMLVFQNLVILGCLQPLLIVLKPFADGLITADEPKGFCMNTKNRIFKQTFKGYLAGIAGIDFRRIEARLGSPPGKAAPLSLFWERITAFPPKPSQVPAARLRLRRCA